MADETPQSTPSETPSAPQPKAEQPSAPKTRKPKGGARPKQGRPSVDRPEPARGTHPDVGWNGGERDKTIAGDKTGMNLEWNDAEYEAFANAIEGKEVNFDAVERSAEERGYTPKKRDDSGRFKAEAEDEAEQVEEVEEVEQEVDTSVEADESAETDDSTDDDVQIEYKGMTLSADQVRALVQRAETSLETEQAAIQAVQQMKQQFDHQQVQLQQLEQLKAVIRSGNGNAVLQLLGINPSTVQPQSVAAPQQAAIDWDDPESIKNGFSQLQQSLQTTEQRMEQRLRQEREQFAQQQQQATHQHQLRNWAQAVVGATESTVREHPAFGRLSPRAQKAVLRDTKETVDRMYAAQRFNPQSGEAQIMAVINQAVAAEVGEWVTESRNTAGRAVQAIQTKRKEMPRGKTPSVVATPMPSKKIAPVPFNGRNLDKFTDSILSEFELRSQHQEIETGG